jgi:hypothetical protein
MAGMEDHRNPFERFTKRRKGKAGTRFMMVCQLIIDKADGMRQMIYEDEVMLAGWNDSQQKGHTVKFWLSADHMGHPFEGISRTSTLIASLVELDDDDEPIDQNMRDRVERQGKLPSERVSYVAAMLCKSEGLWEYIKEQGEWEEAEIGSEADTARVGGYHDVARYWMLMKLGIKSRAELDKDPELAERFHNEIRRPFLDWQGPREMPF